MFGIQKLLYINNGKIEVALDKLKANGHVFEEEGATWFRSTTLVMTKTVY